MKTQARSPRPRQPDLARVDALLRHATRDITEARALLHPRPPVPPDSVTPVPPGADVQAAIDAAHPGDTLALTAGATYTGCWRLRVKDGASDTAPITITTTGLLPPEGARITPADQAQLPTLVAGPGGAPIFATEPGAHHYRLIGLAFAPLAGGINDQLDLGDGSGAQNTLDLVPHHFDVDRCYFYGDPEVGQKRAIGLNCAYGTVRGCYIAGIRAKGQDSQAICGWNGPGPFLIENNHLEAAAENILFGGTDPAIPNLVPSDIEIVGNLVTKPTAWHSQTGWSVKNLIELKNAARVHIHGNIVEYCWADGQSGFGLVLTVRNQSGHAPWSTIQDVLIENNCFRHLGAFCNILACDDGGRASVRMANVRLCNNLVYDVDKVIWGKPSGDVAAGRIVQVGSGPQALSVERNTIVYSSPNEPGTLNSAFYFVKGPYTADAFVVRANVIAEGDYGLMSDANGLMDVPMLDLLAPGWVFDANVLIGGRYGPYTHPPTTITSPDHDVVLNPDYSVAAGYPPSAGVDLTALYAAIPGLDVTA